MRFPINRHRLPQLAADLAIVVAAWFLAFRLRFDTDVPVYYERYLTLGGPRARRRRSSSPSSRSSASTTAGGATSPRATCGARRAASSAASLVTFLVFSFFDIHAADVPRGVWVIDGLLTLALVAGSRMLARTIIERPAEPLARRARQGGDRRRRRRRRAADAAGDAAHAVARLHADRPRSTTTRARRTCACTGSACSARPTSCAHILRDRRPDEVLIAIPSASGEVRAADRRDRARRERAGEDAARA